MATGCEVCDTLLRMRHTNGPRRAKMCRRAYADSEGPDQSDQGLYCPLIESVGTREHTIAVPDQTMHLRCRIWIYPEDIFLHVAAQIINSFSFTSSFCRTHSMNSKRRIKLPKYYEV